MKLSFFPSIIAIVFICLSLIGCRTEFERIRASGDTELIYEKAMTYYEEGDYLRAQTLLELIISSYRGKKEAEQIYFKFAYTHFYQGKYILASYYFKNFANTFTTSPLREEADYMASFSNYKMSPSYRLDQSFTKEAIEGFQTFVNMYPTSSKVEKCNLLIDEMRRKLEKKTFEKAELYFNLKQYQSAVHSFENLLKDFPESPDAERVRYMIVKAKYLLASNSIADKKRERFRETLEKAVSFKTRYPESEFLRDLVVIEKTTSKKLNDLKNE